MMTTPEERIPDVSASIYTASLHNQREELLEPAVQQQVKSLIHQIKTAHQKKQLNTEVEAELFTLTAEITSEEAPDAIVSRFKTALETGRLDTEENTPLSQLFQQVSTQSRFNQLVNRVHQALQTQPLSSQIQTELAQLLTLLSTVHQAPALVNEFDLAISALLATELSYETRKENIKFARKLRKQLAVKLKQKPNPLTSIISASGSPHNRLAAGLSWFFLLFSVGPLTFSLMFFLLGLTRLENDLDQLREAKQHLETQLLFETMRSGVLVADLGRINQLLPDIQTDQLTLISGLSRPIEENSPSTFFDQQQAISKQINRELKTQKELLRKIEADIKSFEIELNSDGIIEETINADFSRLVESLSVNFEEFQKSYSILSNSDTDRETLVNELEKDLQILGEQISEIPILKQKIYLALLAYSQPFESQSVIGEIGEGKDRNVALSTEALEVAGQIINRRLKSDPIDLPSRQSNDEISEAETRINVILAQINQLADQLIGTLFRNINKGVIYMPLVLAVIGAGALGSFVSVAVRADELISKGQAHQRDLFLVGFFRPIIGMSFAFLVVVLIESGIFSGVLSIDAMKPSKKIYLYMAISFVVGFSERLVKSVAGKTEVIVDANRYRKQTN